MTLTLRSYQSAANRATFDYLGKNAGKSPVIELPTGSGKSVVIADFLQQCFNINPNAKGIMVTHVQELVEQNAAAINRFAPSIRTSLYCAGLKQKNLDGQVICASIQSIHKRAYDIQQCNFILIDEAHLIPFKSNTMYRSFIDDLMRINPSLICIGYTATPYRLQGGHLCEGEGALFNEVAYSKPVIELINDGYLAPLVTKHTKTELNYAHVGTAQGDYKKGELEDAIDDEETTRLACAEIVEWGKDRKKWMIFSAGVKHAYNIANELYEHGISCQVIEADTGKSQRASMIKEFKEGSLRCLIGMNVLTTGFDAPNVDLIACLRPTKSPGLWVQILGRGLRISPEKKDCLVLDFGENTDRHGPLNDIKPPLQKGAKKSKKDDSPRGKWCPECFSITDPFAKECADCGYLYPELTRGINHEATASTLDVIETAKPKEPEELVWHKVVEIGYFEHHKRNDPTAPPTMRVEYDIENAKTDKINTIKDWICFEHEDFARNRACRWWSDRCVDTGVAVVPNTVHAALLAADKLLQPTFMTTKKDGSFTKPDLLRFDGDEKPKVDVRTPLESEGVLVQVGKMMEAQGMEARMVDGALIDEGAIDVADVSLGLLLDDDIPF